MKFSHHHCCGLDKKCSPQAHVFEYLPLLVVLLGKSLEPLGGGVLLEEVCHQSMCGGC